jgi:hypothetical protein
MSTSVVNVFRSQVQIRQGISTDRLIPLSGVAGQTIVAGAGGVPAWSDVFSTGKIFPQVAGVGIGMTPTYALDMTVAAGDGIRINAQSGPANIFLRQAGVTNGYINAAGGAGSDLRVAAVRYIALCSANISGSQQDLYKISCGTLTQHQFFRWNGTAMVAAAQIDENGQVGIGVTPTANNGLLQLAAGTTKANGIAFGTDAFLYRSGANNLKLTGAGSSQLSFYLDDTNGPYIGTTSAHVFRLISNNVTAITIDTAQNVGIGITPGGSSKTEIKQIGTGAAAGTRWINYSSADYWGVGYDGAGGFTFGKNGVDQAWMGRNGNKELIQAGGVGQYGANPPAAAPTGYGTPTGGARQGSFAAGSITLPNLAAGVAQLILDLKATGVIAS